MRGIRNGDTGQGGDQCRQFIGDKSDAVCHGHCCIALCHVGFSSLVVLIGKSHGLNFRRVRW